MRLFKEATQASSCLWQADFAAEEVSWLSSIRGGMHHSTVAHTQKRLTTSLQSLLPLEYTLQKGSCSNRPYRAIQTGDYSSPRMQPRVH